MQTESIVEFRDGREVRASIKSDEGSPRSLESTQESQAAGSQPREQPVWPKEIGRRAFYGPAGDFVKVLEPHTEADSVGLLAQLLAGFGNLVGRGPYFPVEADRHYSNEFVVTVGASSKSRKGTAGSRVRHALSKCDEEWARNRILGGLSSGEGAIWAVRDPITKHEPIREKGRVIDYQDIEVDRGVSDKRLYVIEPEFAGVLRQLERDGNTLSPVARQAWDSGNLRTMTKNSPAIATGAHISITGHITREELRRYLSATEQGNGFANRFIWICVKRSKFLPEGGDWRKCENELAPVIERIRRAALFAKQAGEMQRDDEAREIWNKLYRELSGGKPGLLGAVISRAEAHVVRLSCLYALLDESSIIRGQHLEAAVALWQYSEDSCRHIFGDSLGNPDADMILRELRSTSSGLTRTGISGLFSRNKPAAAINKDLDSLVALGLVRCDYRRTEGRSAEVWFAT